MLDNNEMLYLSQIILNMKYLVLRKYLFGDNVHLSKMYASMINPLHLCYMLTFFNLIFSWPRLSENFSCITYQTVIKSLCIVVKLIASFGYFHIEFLLVTDYSFGGLRVSESIHQTRHLLKNFCFITEGLYVIEVRRLIDLCVYVHILVSVCISCTFCY